MIAIQSIDLRGLNQFITGLNRALRGSGQGGDIDRLLKVEAGHLAWEISQQIGPRKKEDATKQINSSLKLSLSTIPTSESRAGSSWRALPSEKVAGFTWLTAGQTFVLGINDEDNRVNASTTEALSAHYVVLKRKSRGKTYQELGKRGHQHVRRLNRMRVKQATLKAARRQIQAKVGQARATFARTAALLVPYKRIPAWVRAQFGIVASKGKSILEDAGLKHPTTPFIQFGSRARGVETNPWIRVKIQNAVKIRSKIAAAKMKKILRGYTFDWNTGQVFKAHPISQE